jgi:hypothetical protein
MSIRKELRLSKSNKFVLSFIILCLITIQITGVSGYISTSSDVKILNAQSNVSSKRFEGYNLYSLDISTYDTSMFLSRKILITDLDGNIHTEREISLNSTIADCPVEFINSTTLLYGESGGTKLWNLETNVTVNLNFEGHHEIEYDYIRNTYYTFSRYVTEIDEEFYSFDYINEHNSSGQIVRSINTDRYCDVSQICPYEDLFNASIDVFHANSLVFDEEDDSMYLNSRGLNTFYKIDRETGDLIWAAGRYGNFTNYDIHGIQKDYLWFHSHGLEKIGENKFLLFDNDVHNQTNAANHESRLVEITIDEDKMQLNETWVWVASEEYWSSIWGDCDLLPNGNKLGVFGYTTYIGKSEGAKIVEVNNNGEKLWELSSPIEENLKYGIYAMDRVRFAPFTSEARLVKTDLNPYFEWDIWYNFRSKTNFTGEYFIYLDDQLVDSKTIIFPKYWQHLTVEYTLPELTEGRHEISIVVADEAGHLSTDSRFYDGMGSTKFSLQLNLKLVLGMSLGIGVPVISVSIFVWLKYIKKRF